MPEANELLGTNLCVKMRALLVEQEGDNLRNNVAHGLLTTIRPGAQGLSTRGGCVFGSSSFRSCICEMPLISQTLRTGPHRQQPMAPPKVLTLLLTSTKGRPRTARQRRPQAARGGAGALI